MAWIKNKETGCIWDIEENNHLYIRLTQHPDFIPTQKKGAKHKEDKVKESKKVE